MDPKKYFRLCEGGLNGVAKVFKGSGGCYRMGNTNDRMFCFTKRNIFVVGEEVIIGRFVG